MEGVADFGDYPAVMPDLHTRSDSTEAIAERLKLLRLAMGYDNQRAFCVVARQEPAAWNNYERAARRISIDAALSISARFGVSLDWIYRGIEAQLSGELISKMREAERSSQASQREAS